MYAKYMKRLLDILLSLTILIVLSPLLLVLCILVRSKLGSPIFFKQERPGLHEKIFTMYKFRTMTDKRDAEGNLLPDKDRLTKFGKLLRATSLDELPEFFNILKGDMSFIGAASAPGFVSAVLYGNRGSAPYSASRPDRSCTGVGTKFSGLGQTACEGRGVCKGTFLSNGFEGFIFDRQGSLRPLGRRRGYQPGGGQFCPDQAGAA